MEKPGAGGAADVASALRCCFGHMIAGGFFALVGGLRCLAGEGKDGRQVRVYRFG